MKNKIVLMSIILVSLLAGTTSVVSAEEKKSYNHRIDLFAVDKSNQEAYLKFYRSFSEKPVVYTFDINLFDTKKQPIINHYGPKDWKASQTYNSLEVDNLVDQTNMQYKEMDTLDYLEATDDNPNYKKIESITKEAAKESDKFVWDKLKGEYTCPLYNTKVTKQDDEYRYDNKYQKINILATEEEVSQELSDNRELFRPRITFNQGGYTSLMYTKVGYYHVDGYQGSYSKGAYEYLVYLNNWKMLTLKDGEPVSVEDVFENPEELRYYLMGYFFEVEDLGLSFGLEYMPISILFLQDGVYVQAPITNIGYSNMPFYMHKVPFKLLKQEINELYGNGNADIRDNEEHFSLGDNDIVLQTKLFIMAIVLVTALAYFVWDHQKKNKK